MKYNGLKITLGDILIKPCEIEFLPKMTIWDLKIQMQASHPKIDVLNYFLFQDAPVPVWDNVLLNEIISMPNPKSG